MWTNESAKNVFGLNFYYLARILPALKFHQLVGLFRLFEYKRLKISLSLAYHIAIGNAFDISQKAVPRFEPMPAAHKVPYGPFSQELPRTQSWLTFEVKRNLSNVLRFIRLRIVEFLLKWFDNDFSARFRKNVFRNHSTSIGLNLLKRSKKASQVTS